jgi:hypothetical protein
MAYNIFLGWPTLSKFTAIPHYAYLVLKMPGPCGVISIRETPSRSMIATGRVARLPTDSWRPQNSKKQTLAESPLNPVMPKAKTSKMSI